MLEPTLTLSRAELFFLPDDTPATAPAMRLQITPEDGEAYSVLARLVQILPLEDNAWLYFRDERRPDDEIICDGDITLGDKDWNGESVTPEFIAKRIIDCRLISRYCSRYWTPPNGDFGIQLLGEEMIVVAIKAHDQNAQIVIYDAFEQDVSPEINQFSSLAQWPNSQVEAFCQDLWSRDDSALNHFFTWQRLSEDEQKAAVSTLQHGDWEEMIQMMRLALELRIHTFGMPLRGEAKAFISIHPHQNAETAADKYLLRWRDALMQIFAPAFIEIEDAPPYVRDLRLKLGLRTFVISFSKLAPTHHEAMEAQIQLREFLAPHLAPDEIEALFRVDNFETRADASGAAPKGAFSTSRVVFCRKRGRKGAK